MGIMGIFNGVTSALKTAETGARIVEKSTDGIINGIGKLVFTEQEKSEINMEAAKAIIDMQKAHTVENSEQSKARRYLAMLTFWFHYCFIIGLVVLYRIDPDWCNEALTVLIKIDTSYLMLMVAGAYFVPYQLSKLGILNGKKNK